MNKVLFLLFCAGVIVSSSGATPTFTTEHHGNDGSIILLSGIAEEQLLGGSGENILEGLIKTVEDLDEYEKALRTIEEEQPEQGIEEPAEPLQPEEPTVAEPTGAEPTGAEPSGETAGPVPAAQPAAKEREPEPDRAAAVPQPAKPEISVNSRNILARLGDNIEVSLEGQGWIYTGEQNGRTGIDFRKRDLGIQETSFSLYAAELGEYSISFQLQDLSKDKIFIEEIHVSVLTDENFAAALTGTKEGIELSQTGSGDYTAARRMVNNGRLDDGLNEFLRQYTDGDSAVNEEIASLAYTIQRYDIAARFWRKNVQEDTSHREDAVAGLLKTAVAVENQEVYDSYIGDFMAIYHPEKGEILISAAIFQEKLGNFQEAMSLLIESLASEPFGLYADLACFRLGKLYEGTSSVRDIQKAVDYYSRIRDEFPGSLYWEESLGRIDYLNRHFLLIR